jgi:hypothetical protein
MMRNEFARSLAAVVLTLLPGGLAAQSKPMAMDHHMAMPGSLSRLALDQIAEARRVAADYDTPEKARAAGYRPRFGNVPLQGEHFSNPQLVFTGTFDIEHPPILMFGSVNGEQKLIGVAYAYEVKDDAPAPDGFDGAAMWHEHPALSLPGRRLVMTHVWFVNSPNGPFAHDNPTLAFLERGIAYPPEGWLDAALTRRLALTLSLARRPAPGASRAITGPRNDSLVRVLTGERDEVDSLVPGLEVARQAGDRASYRRVAADIGAMADRIIATVKQIPADPLVRAFFGRLIDEALSEHPATPES